MKSLIFKLAMTFIVLGAAFYGISALATDNDATEQGYVALIIVDQHDVILFDEDLVYYKGDTFFDVLNRHFELTCANGQYQEDLTCTYAFHMVQSSEKVILNIKGETFEINTNWSDTFIAFEYYEGDSYRLYSQGVMHLSFTDKEQVRIRVTAVNQGSS